jgi:thioredoxin reductase
MAAARQKMIAKRFGGGAANTATGGKGSVRRKKKVATRSSGAQTDAKLSAALKKLGATNIPGVFAAGDCTNVPYKQIIIAMGSGAAAALGAFDYMIRN